MSVLLVVTHLIAAGGGALAMRAWITRKVTVRDTGDGHTALEFRSHRTDDQ